MNNKFQKLYRAPMITQNFNALENGQNQGREDMTTIPLFKHQRTLVVLQTEYEFGVNENNAAKFFTA